MLRTMQKQLRRNPCLTGRRRRTRPQSCTVLALVSLQRTHHGPALGVPFVWRVRRNHPTSPHPTPFLVAACRGAKVKCSRELPCSRCRRLSLVCTPPPTVQRGRPSHHARLAQMRAHGQTASLMQSPSSGTTPFDIKMIPHAFFAPGGVMPGGASANPNIPANMLLSEADPAVFSMPGEQVCSPRFSTQQFAPPNPVGIMGGQPLIFKEHFRNDGSVGGLREVNLQSHMMQATETTGAPQGLQSQQMLGSPQSQPQMMPVQFASPLAVPQPGQMLTLTQRVAMHLASNQLQSRLPPAISNGISQPMSQSASQPVSQPISQQMPQHLQQQISHVGVPPSPSVIGAFNGPGTISSRIESSIKENVPLSGDEILTEVQQMELQYGQAQLSMDALRAQLLRLGVRPCA